MDYIVEANKFMYDETFITESSGIEIDNKTKFWVVTVPTKNSELVDILFETDLLGLSRQFKGGLKPEEIIGLYSDEKKARNVAGFRLNHVKK